MIVQHLFSGQPKTWRENLCTNARQSSKSEIPTKDQNECPQDFLESE
jgi:hypothetical protein